MVFEFTDNRGCRCHYADIPEQSPADGYYPELIEVDTNSSNWEYSCCHEIAHALGTELKKNWATERSIDLFRRELFTWRLAKSYCKPRYIDDEYSIRCLKSYARRLGYNINWDKLRIIPVNTNKYLHRRLKK